MAKAVLEFPTRFVQPKHEKDDLGKKETLESLNTNRLAPQSGTTRLLGSPARSTWQVYLGNKRLMSNCGHSIRAASMGAWINVVQLLSLPEHDIVKSLSPCKTPSQVWIPLEFLTGMVPSPDSILVRSCPLALRFGCLSDEDSADDASWGEKIRASPQGAVLMYKWNRTEACNYKVTSHSLWSKFIYFTTKLVPYHQLR